MRRISYAWNRACMGDALKYIAYRVYHVVLLLVSLPCQIRIPFHPKPQRFCRGLYHPSRILNVCIATGIYKHENTINSSLHKPSSDRSMQPSVTTVMWFSLMSL